MNFGELKSMFRATVPAATASAINDANLSLLLNRGALDVAQRTQCLKNFAYVNAEAGVNRYPLSTKLSRFLGLEESGVWFLEGTVYTELFPRTMRQLDNEFITWRSDTADSANYYTIYGDNLMPVPFPDANLSNAFLIYYFERPLTMVDNVDYPFHATTSKLVERTDLSILADSILLYVENKVLKLLNKRQDAAEKWNEYLEDLEAKKPLIRSRMDIASHRDTKMQGPTP